ncbi:fumarylacetoacetate hydrolase family protein [Pseudonocardia sp. NPDC049635]|uniref:fumarylacetoacetate hydrolase family protein n=1 Tax=Pseudonocardia sp. NPDC049635 TaxID=3155506 RepID=UPI0033F2694A
MRILNLSGRLAIEVDDGHAVDVAHASAGRFGPDPQSVYQQWDEFVSWAEGGFDRSVREPVEPGSLGAPAPRPGQVFAVGLNYREHASEAGLDLPEIPVVFTKFPSSVTGPSGVIALPKGSVDFEVELVAVVGRAASGVDAATAWTHIAGLTVGQDLSERELQLAGPAPQQFSMGKSYPGFAPVGPVLVTPDEFDDPDDIAISCTLNGVEVQRTRTSDMIFSIPAIVEFLSAVVTLWPGDLIFTGTPSGVGWARDPKLLIGAGDELVTGAEGIGQMRHTFRNT